MTTDGVTYFTQLRSVIFDRDLDVAAEFAFLDQPPRPNHVVPVGPSSAVVAALLDRRRRRTSGRAADGGPRPLNRGAGLGPALRARGAAVVVRDRCRGPGGAPPPSTARVLAAGGDHRDGADLRATPLYWYMVYEPSMTHAASFGFVALFVVCAARWVPPGATVRQSLVTGRAHRAGVPRAVAGVAVRAVSGGAGVERGGTPPGERVRRALTLAGWAFLGALPWILLQLGHSYVLFTRYEYHLRAGRAATSARCIPAGSIRCSRRGTASCRGPRSAYVAVVGTFAYLRRSWRWAASALVILFLTAWVNGATLDWAGGWSFGGRRFSSALVMLAPGLALVIEFVLRRPLLALAPALAGAIWWNHLLMVQYTAGMLPKDEPVSFGRIVRQQAELQTRSPYWYPFAFPANVWFAWRERCPGGQVRRALAGNAARDVLARVRSHGGEVPAVGVGRAGRRRLGTGVVDWRQPGADGRAARPGGWRGDDLDPVAHTIRRAARRRGDRARGQRRRSGQVQGGRAGCVHGRDRQFPQPRLANCFVAASIRSGCEALG